MTAIDTQKSQHASADGPTGSPPERFTSHDPDAFGVPTGREEEWRFTPLRKLRKVLEPFQPDDSLTLTVSTPDGVRITTADRSHPLFGSVIVPADRVSALAAANVGQVTVVSIPADAVIDEPIVLTCQGDQGLNYTHLIIDAGSYSRATVVLDNVGGATVAGNVESSLADGAKLTVISVQDGVVGDGGAIHLAAHGALVGRDATYVHTSVNLGGAIVRINPTVRFAGPGGSATLYGLSFTQDGQHHESRLYVDHSAPECTSEVVYKSVVDGDKARSVWIGDVRIRPAAVGTSTYELNRNLLLSDGARADSVPNLEIETGEIAGAGHASATGRFDDQQLFYLQARGIPEDEARRLVVRGFLADVLAHIEAPSLHDRLMASIDARLGMPTSPGDDE